MAISTIKRCVPQGRKYLSSVSSIDKPTTYSGGVQLMHWAMGGSMLASVGLVLQAQNTKDKKMKGNFMFFHKSFGFLSFLFLAPRLAIRFASKTPSEIVGTTTIEQYLAKAGHLVMYGFALCLPISGTIMGYYGGNGLPFFYTTIPSGTKDGKLAKQAYGTHT